MSLESFGKFKQLYLISLKVFSQLCFLISPYSYSVFLSSIAGVMLSDYYFVRKGYFSVPFLYNADSDGPYWYAAGFNPKAYVPPSGNAASNFRLHTLLEFSSTLSALQVQWDERFRSVPHISIVSTISAVSSCPVSFTFSFLDSGLRRRFQRNGKKMEIKMPWREERRIAPIPKRTVGI